MPRHMTRFFFIVSKLSMPRIGLLMFLDSGHGGRLPDQKGDEVDGYDDSE